jgi:hypothetical protein
MVWDSNSSNMEELNANEREWAMGFCTNFTVVPFFLKEVISGILDKSWTLIASHGFSI